jgi:hypothetical protein
VASAPPAVWLILAGPYVLAVLALIVGHLGWRGGRLTDPPARVALLVVALMILAGVIATVPGAREAWFILLLTLLTSAGMYLGVARKSPPAGASCTGWSPSSSSSSGAWSGARSSTEPSTPAPASTSTSRARSRARTRSVAPTSPAPPRSTSTEIAVDGGSLLVIEADGTQLSRFALDGRPLWRVPRFEGLAWVLADPGTGGGWVGAARFEGKPGGSSASTPMARSRSSRRS